MVGTKKSKEPISPSKRKALRKQKEDQKTKQYLTHDFAYTGIPGAKATAKGVSYRVNKIKLPKAKEFGSFIKKKKKNYANK